VSMGLGLVEALIGNTAFGLGVTLSGEAMIEIREPLCSD
jgi:hypothetical protein